MKRIVALILTVIMIFALVACDKEKAEKYCWSCGEGITKSAVFCEHCGAKINESSNDTTTTTTTTSHSEEEETSTTKADETNTSSTTQTANQHSTTTSKATTTTTTKPSTNTSQTTTTTTTTTTKKTTTAHTHSYYKYVCTGCGAVDKTHAYEYLMEWVKVNGTKDGTSIEYVFKGKNNSADCYGLTYSETNDCIYVWHYDGTMTYSAFTAIYLDDYYYSFSFGGDRVSGYIKPTIYTQNTALTYIDYDCSVLAPEKYLSAAQSDINVILLYLDGFLAANLSINIYDLGFKSFW